MKQIILVNKTKNISFPNDWDQGIGRDETRRRHIIF